jgi:SM-20-related protein
MSSSGQDTIVLIRPTGIMPPHLVLHDFLDEDTVAGLLDYALSHQAEFAPARLRSKKVDPSIRVSTSTRKLGRYHAILTNKILAMVPGVAARLQVTSVKAPDLEIELVAHGDGAFYKRHIDTGTGSYEHANHIRVLSGVYYFYAAPKAFSGGALRLHAMGGNKDRNFVDIEPVRNSLLIFPSWAPHEVMPVSCPSQRFIDSRFAINCWVRCDKSEIDT